MKKFKAILVLAAALLCRPGFAQSVNFAALGVGGYNSTWEGYGGLDLRARFTGASGLDAAINIEALSSGANALSLSGTQSFEVGPGRFNYTFDVLGRSLKPYDTKEAAGAISIGYRLDHVSAQLGIFTRTIWGAGDRLREPVGLLYKGTVTLMSAPSPWNIYLTVTDYTEYTFERMWQPVFILGGYADISNSLRLLGEATLQPAGVFHLDAAFYGFTARAGLQYYF